MRVITIDDGATQPDLCLELGAAKVIGFKITSIIASEALILLAILWHARRYRVLSHTGRLRVGHIEGC
ncbi:hypothetical protein GQ44DRAFT_716418 [Phaeosphaeriaceae sp. PMI808]|nr:hypothetical protein GQ44DRAFT_716418 [Phaeosphaeriaceae sp. PMI808]